MKDILKNACIALGLLLVLAGCGGGGGGTQTTGATGPYINLAVVLADTGPGGGLRYSVWGIVNESSFTSLPITDAVVAINGNQLTYNATIKQYVASNLPMTLPDANGKLNLTVAVRGTTYSATQDAPNTLPVVTLPATLVAANTNIVSWTQNVSTWGLVPTYFYLTVYPSASTGTTTWQTKTTNTSATIPANSFAIGTNYCFSLNADYNMQPIANTAQASGYFVLAVPTSTCMVAQ